MNEVWLLIGLTLGVAVTSIIVALLVLLKNPTSWVNRWLFMFLLSGSVWITLVSVSLQGQFSSEYGEILLVQTVFAAAVCMGFSALSFARSLANIHWFQKDSWLLPLGIFLCYLPGSGIRGLEHFDSVVKIVYGPMYPVVILILLYLLGRSLYVLVHQARKTRGEKSRQAQIIAFGLTVGIISGVSTNLLLPNLLHNSNSSRYGFIAIILWTTILTYAIVQHRFLDIRLVVARAVTYSLLLFTLVTIYVTAVFSVIQLFFGATQGIASGQTVVYLGSAVFLSFTYNPLKKFFDKVTDRIFFRHDYDPQDVLKRLGDVAVDEIDLKRVSIKSLAILEEALKPKFASMYVLSAAREFTPYRFAVGETSLRMRREVEEELFMSIGKVREEIIVADLLEDDQLKLQRAMHDANVALIVRLETSRELVGHLFFGPKQNGSIYNSKDLQMLDTVGDELALAIQNSLRFQEIRDFNETLQERVNTATAELRRTNAKLQQLDAAKDEFISMASHQLRTPLTTVKGYLSMVLEGDAGDISHMQRKLLDEAYASSQRMVGLISDFLNVSRLKTGKFVLEPSAVALPGLITEEIDQLRATAGARELTLNYTPPENYPVLKLDENKMRQVIMNFIDNAIYYSRAGGEITIEVLYNGKEAIFKVHDQGIGVPAGERPHLFTKFYRASNARKARPDGTGIGLFMAKKVIVAHGGAVIFESKEGKGSTFGFQVPAAVIARNAKKLSEAPRTKTK